jgi:transposase
MRTYYVGLDVHSKQTSFVIEDKGGRVIAQGEIPTTPEGLSQLQTTYHFGRGTQVALETGTVAFFVARPLGRLGLDPIVVDAHEVRIKAHRPNQKSDARDALELCEGLRRGIYRSIVHVPGQEISRLRDTLSRRRHFVRLQAAQVGAVKALLRAAGLGRLSRSLGSEAGWARVLAAVVEHEELRTYVEQHRSLWRCAREQISALDASLARQDQSDFDVGKLGVERGPFERKVVRAYRLKASSQ